MAPAADALPRGAQAAVGTGCLTKIILWTFGISIVAGAILALLPSPPGQTMRETIGDGPEAAVMCHEFLKDRLKSPATANFQPVRDSDISRVQDSWRVRSYVDSQNGFGAMLRTTYTCQVTYQPGTKKWRLDDLTTGDR